MILDALAALAIVGALALALAATMGRQHRAAQKLADTRAAVQVAETVLADLQAGKPAPADQSSAGDPDVKVEIRPAAGGRPGSKTSWVEVVVAIRGGRASLVGAVPEGGTR
jgi:type II secretory pathway pseudopilin PulG